MAENSFQMLLDCSSDQIPTVPYSVRLGALDAHAELGNSMGRVFLESPAGRRLIKKFPACYQTLKFIAVFTRAHCLVVCAGGPGLKIVYSGQGF